MHHLPMIEATQIAAPALLVCVTPPHVVISPFPTLLKGMPSVPAIGKFLFPGNQAIGGTNSWLVHPPLHKRC